MRLRLVGVVCALCWALSCPNVDSLHHQSVIRRLSAQDRLEARTFAFRQMSKDLPPPSNGYKVVPLPEAVMNIKPDFGQSSFVEVSADMTSPPDHDKNPLLKFADPFANDFGPARKCLRENEEKKFTYADDVSELRGFDYTYFFDGSVASAVGFVSTDHRVDLSNAAYFICDSAYLADFKIQRDRRMWHTGHVIAAALGGDNFDPINFFPQHMHSNSGGGVWWRLERLVGETQKAMAGSQITTKKHKRTGEPCRFAIKPQLLYKTDASKVPFAGYYSVELEDSCYRFLMDVLKPKLTGYAAHMANWFSYAVKIPHVYADMGDSIPGWQCTERWMNEDDRATFAKNPNMYAATYKRRVKKKL